MKFVAAFALLVLSAALTRAEEKKPTDPFQGSWKPLSVVVGGMEAPKEQVAKTAFVVKDDKLTFGGKKDGITFVVGPNEKPPSINLSFKEGGQVVTVPGIYHFDGDKLTICFEFDATGTRPAEFKSEPKSRTVIWVLERVKK